MFGNSNIVDRTEVAVMVSGGRLSNGIMMIFMVMVMSLRYCVMVISAMIQA